MIRLFVGDCEETMASEAFKRAVDGRECVIVTDPPFNIGYHYGKCKDRMPEAAYYAWLKRVLASLGGRFAVVHYPEGLHRLSIELGQAPTRVVSWCYNSNTPRQHRDVAYYGVKPIMSQVTQPYKNQTDRRIKALMAKGRTGGAIYDWCVVNQVKNVSKEKTGHPCQMPLEVMRRAVGVLPKGCVVVDPFMGSGTTGLACKEMGYDFVGIEMDGEYAAMAAERLGAAIEGKERADGANDL